MTGRHRQIRPVQRRGGCCLPFNQEIALLDILAILKHRFQKWPITLKLYVATLEIELASKKGNRAIDGNLDQTVVVFITGACCLDESDAFCLTATGIVRVSREHRYCPALRILLADFIT